MLQNDLLTIQVSMRALYAMCMEPVCQKYGMTRTELDILLFLANNPQYDTAAEIVNIRLLAKSHVSTSLKALEKNGYITKHAVKNDKRLIRLKLTAQSDEVVREGRQRQSDVVNIIFAGLGPEDRERLRFYIAAMEKNIKEHMEVHAK